MIHKDDVELLKIQFKWLINFHYTTQTSTEDSKSYIPGIIMYKLYKPGMIMYKSYIPGMIMYKSYIPGIIMYESYIPGIIMHIQLRIKLLRR